MEEKVLPYINSNMVLANTHSGDCGVITKCELRAKGCVNQYNGNVQLTMSNVPALAIKAKQNVVLGYKETLCVICENKDGSKNKKDNWIVH